MAPLSFCFLLLFIFMSIRNKPPNKFGPSQLYQLSPDSCYFLQKKLFENSRRCVEIAHYYPLSAYNSARPTTLIASRSNRLTISEYHAHDLIRLLELTLTAKAELPKVEPKYEGWKYPKNSEIIRLWDNTTVRTDSEVSAHFHSKSERCSPGTRGRARKTL